MRALLPAGTTENEFAGRGLGAAMEFALNHGGEGVSIWEGGLEPADIATIHDAGLLAWVWTVNDSLRAQELLDMGVDGICTDDPELIQGLQAPGLGARRPAARVGG